MSSHSSIVPIDWRAIVAEGLRRRRAEGLTQKEHAALASVSIPTMIAFERSERTLSLGKAFDILRVVGLVVETPEEGAQEIFVREAFVRWRELTAKLPNDSPARFPNGWYRFDYELKGELREPSPRELLAALERVELTNTGWPLFVTLETKELSAYENDGDIECWVRPIPNRTERSLDDAAHCDFWRVSPAGRALIMRGFQEDTQETFKPQTLLDTTLPIWRMAEGLLHSARLARELQVNETTEIVVHFRALYTGLSGRVLRAWANPLSDPFLTGTGARTDEVLIETTVVARDIEINLAAAVLPLVAALYDRFGVVGLTSERIASEVDRFLQGSAARR